MKIILLILAGLSAFWILVIAAILKERRRNTKPLPSGAVRTADSDKLNRINTEYRNFLNYNGSKQN